MLTRRGFLLSIGLGGGCLWLSTKTTLVVSLSEAAAVGGDCSICGRMTTQSAIVAGSIERRPRICGQCVDVSAKIIGEELGIAAPSFSVVPDPAQERMAAEVLSYIKELRTAHHEVRTLARHSPKAMDPAVGHYRCSFCDAHRSDVKKLISGREARICDRCVFDSLSSANYVSLHS